MTDNILPIYDLIVHDWMNLEEDAYGMNYDNRLTPVTDCIHSPYDHELLIG